MPPLAPAKGFVAREPQSRLPVALELLDPRKGSDREHRARFERGSETIPQLAHPNLVRRDRLEPATEETS